MDPLLSATAPLLATAFDLWGTAVTWLEVVAFLLSIAMVICNLRVHVAGWPLAIASSILYSVLFAHSKLYGEAALQWAFVAVAAWGWWRWAQPMSADAGQQGIGRLSTHERWKAAGLTLLAWPLLGRLLSATTDSDVPYLDALPTVASLTGQWLLARKRIENWVVWWCVNLFSVLLFAYKHLWLTVGLYAVFAALSWLGWRSWQRLLHAAPRNSHV